MTGLTAVAGLEVGHVTDEYAASHYFKRLTVIVMTFGDTLFQLGEVSRRMQTTAGVFA